MGGPLLRETLVVLGCFVILYAIGVHLYNNRRIGGGAVLVAVMLALQTVVHPTAEQAIVQQFENTAEDDDSGDGDHTPSIERQIRDHAKRVRSGESRHHIVLKLPPRSRGRTSN